MMIINITFKIKGLTILKMPCILVALAIVVITLIDFSCNYFDRILRHEIVQTNIKLQL